MSDNLDAELNTTEVVASKSDAEIMRDTQRGFHWALLVVPTALILAFAFFVPLGPQILAGAVIVLILGFGLREVKTNLSGNPLETWGLTVFACGSALVLWAGGFWAPLGLDGAARAALAALGLN